MLPVGLRLRLPGTAARVSGESTGGSAAAALQELLQGVLERVWQPYPRKAEARLGLLQLSGVRRTRQLQAEARCDCSSYPICITSIALRVFLCAAYRIPCD